MFQDYGVSKEQPSELRTSRTFISTNSSESETKEEGDTEGLLTLSVRLKKLVVLRGDNAELEIVRTPFLNRFNRRSPPRPTVESKSLPPMMIGDLLLLPDSRQSLQVLRQSASNRPQNYQPLRPLARWRRLLGPNDAIQHCSYIISISSLLVS